MRHNFQSDLSPVPPKMYAAPEIPKNVACYRILRPCFLDDIMFYEGDVVTWSEEPNSEMEPLNDLARKASDAFFDKCEELGKLAAKEKGKSFVPVQRPFSERRRNNTAETRRVELVKGDGGVPIMGARKGPGRPPKAQKLEVSKIEQKPVSDLARTGKAAANAVKDNKIDS